MSTALPYLALATAQILFGINFIVSKKIVAVMDPLFWCFFRLLFASMIIIPICFFLKRKPIQLNKKNIFSLVVLSFFGIILNQGAFLIGLSKTSATNASILLSTVPIFTLLIVTLRGQEIVGFRKVFGIGVSFVGVLILRRFEDYHFSDETFIGDLFILLNSLSYAFFFSLSHSFVKNHDQFWTTAYLFIIGALFFFFSSFTPFINPTLPSFSSELLGLIIFAVVGATLCTYFLNIWSLRHIPSSIVSLFIYIQPLVATILGVFLFSEELNARKLCSFVLIIGGLITATMEKIKASTKGLAFNNRKN